jgi:hypothetical protein
MSGSSSNVHKARYKNMGLDSQELRRRREEEGIQLRKQKREQQLFKRRNVHADESLQVTTGGGRYRGSILQNLTCG